MRWLQRFAENEIRNASRKKGNREVAVSGDVHRSEVAPLRKLQREERRVRLRRSLDGLVETEREAIRLAREEGLPIKEVAERLGKTVAATKSIVFRALRKLERSMGPTDSFRLPSGR